MDAPPALALPLPSFIFPEGSIYFAIPAVAETARTARHRFCAGRARCRCRCPPLTVLHYFRILKGFMKQCWQPLLAVPLFQPPISSPFDQRKRRQRQSDSSGRSRPLPEPVPARARWLDSRRISYHLENKVLCHPGLSLHTQLAGSLAELRIYFGY